MKRIALLTMLVALFFGSLAVVLAGPLAPPQQYYVRWKSPVIYTCTHTPGDYYQLDVLPATYDYYVPQGAQMIAVEFDKLLVWSFFRARADGDPLAERGRSEATSA